MRQPNHPLWPAITVGALWLAAVLGMTVAAFRADVSQGNIARAKHDSALDMVEPGGEVCVRRYADSALWCTRVPVPEQEAKGGM